MKYFIVEPAALRARPEEKIWVLDREGSPYLIELCFLLSVPSMSQESAKFIVSKKSWSLSPSWVIISQAEFEVMGIMTV